MTDENYLEQLEEDMYKEVDENFEQREPRQDYNYREIGRRKEIEEIHARRERMGLKSLKY